MRILILLLTSALLIPPSACSRTTSRTGQTESHATPQSLKEYVQTAKEAGWVATLNLNPIPAVSARPTTFTLKLVDSKGAPIKDAEVHFILLMALMDMGKNEFAGMSRGDGTYIGSGTFSMDGIWIVEADIDRRGQKAHLEFEIHVNVP